MVSPLGTPLLRMQSTGAPRTITVPVRAAVARVTNNETGEDIVSLRDAGHCTLAEMLQLLGGQDRSSLYLEDNRALTLRIHVGTRPMWRKVTKIEGALTVLGVLLAIGLIDQAVAQKQQQANQIGQSQVQIVPQTSGYQAPKPYQVTPQTSQPTPMYPQSQPRRQSGR